MMKTIKKYFENKKENKKREEEHKRFCELYEETGCIAYFDNVPEAWWY